MWGAPHSSRPATVGAAGRRGRGVVAAAAPLLANAAASQHRADFNDAAPPPMYQQLDGVAVVGGSALDFGNVSSPTWALPSAPRAADGVVEVRASHAHTGTPTWALPAGSVSGGK
jgi:hypothetical protein